MPQQQNDRKPGDANRLDRETKPGAGGQTGGHVGETDRKDIERSKPVPVNQGGLSSDEGEGKINTEGSPRQDVNNRITGTNPYTGANDPKTGNQRAAGKMGSEYGSEGNESQSGTGSHDRSENNNQKQKP
jgi:hypothetical protein